MNEHTSKELSERLDALGFKADHVKTYPRVDIEDGYYSPACTHRGLPTYTFTELWKVISYNMRLSFLLDMSTDMDLERNDLAEIAGEWLITEGHMEVSK